MKKQKQTITSQIINNLYAKFGKKPFRFTDIQREVVEFHGLNYDERKFYDKANPAIRVHRGWWCDPIYDHESYLYKTQANGLKLNKENKKYFITKVG